MIPSRPQSLAEVARRVIDGATFRMELADFLDDFYKTPHADSFAEAPVFLAQKTPRGEYKDAFLAATAEHLARKYQLTVTDWVFDPRRSLDNPSFDFQTREAQLFLLKDSPGAFKSRNLFVTGNVLERV